MKGLNLSEQYFRACGLARLKAECGEDLSKLTIGLVGDGSECLGFDDKISRDHDWGLGFCIWIDKQDYQSIGTKLQNIYKSLPESFGGYKARTTSRWGKERIGVLETGRFYQRYLGLPGAPETLKQWLVISEHALASATNGKIFIDSSGTFSTIRKTLLNGYPHDVKLKKIAARCMAAGREGQYNYPRAIQRKEIYAAAQAEMKFLEAALSLVFLINNRYLPFYKWAQRTVRELPNLGLFTDQTINKMIRTNLPAEKEQLIETLAQKIINQLKSLGFSSSHSNFLPDHGLLVQEHIKDKEIRGYNVWVG